MVWLTNGLSGIVTSNQAPRTLDENRTLAFHVGEIRKSYYATSPLRLYRTLPWQVATHVTDCERTRWIEVITINLWNP